MQNILCVLQEEKGLPYMPSLKALSLTGSVSAVLAVCRMIK